MALSRSIDVSHHQGSIDWARLKAAQGLTWGACKATEGLTFRDSQFARNWANMKAAGLVRVAYHFGRPGSSSTEQARRFLEVVRPAAGDVVCLDLEKSDNKTQAQCNAWAKAFGTYLRAHTDCTTMVYLGGYSANGTGRGLSAYFDWWWYPRYATMDPVSVWPRTYAPRLKGNTTGWAAPHVWQWAASLRTAEGLTDANVSPLTARQLAAGPAAPAPTPEPPVPEVGDHDDYPLPAGDEMPATNRRTSWTGARALASGTWREVPMTDEGPSLVAAPCTVQGVVDLVVECKAGTTVQVRPVLVALKAGEWVPVRSLEPDERVATSGRTFIKVPVTVVVGAGQRLRVQVSAAGKVTHTHSELLLWK